MPENSPAGILGLDVLAKERALMTKRGVASWGVAGAAAALAALAAWWSFHYAQSRYHWHEARVAFEDQDQDRARVHLAECLPWWNGRSEVRFLAAQAARLAGDYEEAEEHLAFCERQRGLPAADLQRERALLQVQQGDLHYLKYLAPQGPDDPRLSPSVLEAAARGLEATSFFDQAMVYLQRLLQQEAENARGHLLAGSILVRKRYADQALPHFQAAVHQLPNALTPRLQLAECLLDMGEAREAATHLEALHQRYPDAPELLLAQARLAVYRAQPVEAKRILRQLLARDANHVEALVTLGRIEFRHGEPREALTWLRRAVQVHPNHPEAWEALARCHAALAEPDEEKSCLAEFARVGRELGEATRLIILVMLEKQNDRDLRIELAERYERLHEPAKAIRWRMCTLHLDPGHAATHRALAELFERTGQPHRAARHRTLAEG